MATGPQKSSFSKKKKNYSLLPIAFFFFFLMFITKSFTQTTTISSLTYSIGGLEDHQEKRQASSATSLHCSAYKNRYRSFKKVMEGFLSMQGEFNTKKKKKVQLKIFGQILKSLKSPISPKHKLFHPIYFTK